MSSLYGMAGGLLRFELTERYGVQSAVIDPCFIKLNSMLHRKIRKVTKNRPTSCSGDVVDSVDKLLQSLRCFASFKGTIYYSDARRWICFRWRQQRNWRPRFPPFSQICASFEPIDIHEKIYFQGLLTWSGCTQTRLPKQ